MRAKRLILTLALLLVAGVFTPARAADPDRVQEGFCGAPWGASQAATKEAVEKRLSNVVFVDQDSQALYFRGEITGFPAEFCILFAAGKMAAALVLIPDPHGTVFGKVAAAQVDEFGPPDLTEEDASGPGYIWKFRSGYKPPPDFAAISVFKTRGSFIYHGYERRPAVAIYCYDHELEQQYRQARSAANNK